MPAINLSGADLETYLDHRGEEVRAHFGLQGITLSPADARQRAVEAVTVFHHACDALNKPRRTPTPEEVITTTGFYLFERDTPGSRTRMDTYASDSVRLR